MKFKLGADELARIMPSGQREHYILDKIPMTLRYQLWPSPTDIKWREKSWEGVWAEVIIAASQALRDEE